MANRLKLPRSTSPGFPARSSPPSNSAGSIAVEPPLNGAGYATFDKIDKLKQELALSQESALIRLAELERENAALQLEVVARRDAERLASAQSQTIARTLETWTTNPSIDVFATQVLLAIADQLGAKDAALWLHDQQLRRLTLHLNLEDGSLRTASDGGHPGWDSHADEENVHIDQQKIGREPAVLPADFIDNDPSMARYRDYLRQRETRTILAVPMFLGETYFGSYTVSHDFPRSYTHAELTIAKALAGQAMLAMHTARLAEQAKQAAIAREQEEAATRRAEVLARANAAMAKTVGRLVEQPEIRNFVGEVLSVFATEFDAVGVEYWHYHPASRRFKAALSYDRASGVLLADENDWQSMSTAKSADDPDQAAQIFARQIVSYSDEDFDTLLSPFAEKLRIQGIRNILCVPMFIKDECLGSIALRIDHERTLNAAEQELAFALAQQLALALQLTRLAEEAKQIAIAREQEEAAQQRVAQLAKANEILRSTVDKMTSIPAIEEFLGAVMLAINESLGAHGSTFWMFDFERRRSELAMTAIAGTWSPTPPVYDGSTLVSGYALPPEYVEQIQSSGRWLFTPNIREHSLIDEGTRNWLKHLGVVALHEFAIVVGRKTIGTLVIHCEANEPFPAEKLELAVVLAQQLGLAIHITRLAEEVKQAAIAREQEEAARQRAAVLARANVVMSKTLGRLVEDPGIRNFTGQVLDVFATEFDAIGVEFWSYDGEANWFSPTLSFDRATGELTGDDNDFQRLNGRQDVRDHSGHEATLAGRITRITSKEIEEAPYLASYREKLQADGVRTILGVPLQVKDEHLGTICMRFQRDRTLTTAEEELAFALAQQLALALQLSRLAEEAQQAAIAREQERAALDQAAELVKANRAISSSLAKLAAYPDVEGFLGQILLSITTHLGEADGGVWLYDQSLNTLILRLSLEDGVLVKEGFHVHAKWLMFDESDEDAAGGTAKAHGLHNRVTMHTLEEIRTSPVWEPYREAIEQGDFQCTMEVPMFVGDELIGFYAIRAKHHTTFSASEIELAQALAHQAALACHVRRLAEQTAESAQQTAIAEERNRLARDIHDTLAQGFAAIAMQLQGATRERASLPRAVRPYLERAIELTRDNLAEARKSVGALRSHESPSGGFLPTLTRLIEEARKRSSALIELKLDCQSLFIPRNVEDELLRIAQEALNNATKHASAKRILIDVTAAGDGLRLKIQDDGTGFNADMPTAGYGLGIMQERAKRVGATWTLITEPDNGTEVIAVWSPKPEPSEKND